MTINLTPQELDYISESRSAGFVIDETVTTPSTNEGLFDQVLPTGRKILAVHHYESDKLTIYAVEEAPPPIEILKINNLIETSEQFRSLLSN